MAVTCHELSPADCPRPMTAAIRDEVEDLARWLRLDLAMSRPRGKALAAAEMLGASGEGGESRPAWIAHPMSAIIGGVDDGDTLCTT